MLGRIGNNIALMKPLVQEDQIKVAKKEFQRIFDQLIGLYELKSLRLENGFFERLTEAFF